MLINLNFGPNFKKLEWKEKLIEHIRIIDECNQQSLYRLDFLEKLPCNSYKVFSKKNRNELPLLFKRPFLQISDKYIEELNQKRKAEVLRQLVEKGFITEDFRQACDSYDIEEQKGVNNDEIRLNFLDLDNDDRIVRTVTVKRSDIVYPPSEQ